MKKIKLTQDRYALVDDADYKWLDQWKWSVMQNRYAHRNAGGGKWIRMHRLIMNPPGGINVDHINGDGLDNRRNNLRFCSQSENMSNRGANKNSKSGFKDIFWQTDRKKWFVQVMKEGKKFHGGRHNNLKDAIKARDTLVAELHGEYARV